MSTKTEQQSGPILVSGLGRCGTSLVMQMLHAGGVQCTGKYPSFEDVRTSVDMDVEWLRKQSGRAVKLLDPQRSPPSLAPPFEAIIWLSRDLKEQAKAQAKLLRVLLGVDADWRAMRRGLISDTPRALTLLRSFGAPLLALRFEAIVQHPRAAASAIAELLPRHDVNVEAATRVVLPRGWRCLPGMLEAELLRRGVA